jgi:hypothetical protein
MTGSSSPGPGVWCANLCTPVDITGTTAWVLTRGDAWLSTIHRSYYDYYPEMSFP